MIRRFRSEDMRAIWALSQIPHIGSTADPSAPLDLSRDDPGSWEDLWDIGASHIAQGGDFLVYELDGRVVGMGAVMPDGSGTAEVNHLRVHPALRRRGIGRAVMRALERRAIELGCVRTHLDTTVAQPEAAAFYRSLGYEEAGREKFPDWELIFFTKDLRGDTTTSTGVQLVGERVVLREFAMDDVDAMYAYLSDDEVFRQISWDQPTLAETTESVREAIEAARATPRRDYELAVTLRETGEVVGQVTLKTDRYIPRIRQRTSELGYMLRRDCWGRGITTEAARLLLDVAFGDLGLHRVFAVVGEDHPASIRVLEKLGFRREARHVKDAFHQGEWFTTLIYAVLEEEWIGRPT